MTSYRAHNAGACRAGRLLSGLAVAFCLAGPLHAQATLQDYRQVGYIYAQNPQLFRNLFQNANTQTLRIAILGDSQETSPTSHGFQYIPLLNYQMWKRYGNVPETPMESCTTYGAGTPPADWLMRGLCSTPGPVATRLSASQILPNVFPAAFSTLNSSTNVTGGSHGQLTMLQSNAANVDPSAGIPTNVDYFDTTGTVKARIFAATNASSGEISYRARPTNSTAPSYSVAATTTGTLTLGLQSGTFSILSGDTPALDYNGNKYMALEVYGSEDSKLTDIVGLRFFNESHPEGVVFDTFSHGGYEASDFLNGFGSAGPMFSAFGFQAAILHYGANEGAVSAAQYQTVLTSIIARLRSWVGDPTFPVIIITDPYEEGLAAADQTQYDMYAGADLAVAQADPYVMAVNSRRLMEDIGWNATSGQASQFLLSDGVHYTALAAQSLAAADAAAMLGEVNVSGCLTDPDSVTLDSSTTLTMQLGGTTACSGYSQYTNSQTLTLNQSTLTVTLSNSYAPALGAQFNILKWGTLSGTFATVNLPALPSGQSWDTSALYTTGTITVVTATAPAVGITSGGSQTLTDPTAVTPIGFTLTGTSPLTVTAASSNTTLLPASGIALASGCGTSTLNCTATVTLASGQTGSTTVTLTATDPSGRTATGTATIQVSASSGSPGDGSTGGGSTGGSTGSTGSTTSSGGGGGSLDVLSPLGLAALAALRRRRNFPHPQV